MIGKYASERTAQKSNTDAQHNTITAQNEDGNGAGGRMCPMTSSGAGSEELGS
jgi:hypothetical protein